MLISVKLNLSVNAYPEFTKRKYKNDKKIFSHSFIPKSSGAVHILTSSSSAEATQLLDIHSLLPLHTLVSSNKHLHGFSLSAPQSSPDLSTSSSTHLDSWSQLSVIRAQGSPTTIVEDVESCVEHSHPPSSPLIQVCPKRLRFLLLQSDVPRHWSNLL